MVLACAHEGGLDKSTVGHRGIETLLISWTEVSMDLTVFAQWSRQWFLILYQITLIYGDLH